MIRPNPYSFPDPTGEWRRYADGLERNLADFRAEVARHHQDFERWEKMADKGAAQMATLEALHAVIKRMSWGWQARRNASGELCWCRANVLEPMAEDEALAYMTAINRADKLFDK